MPGHLAARLGCAETKVATWDDLAFKLIILRWNVKHREKDCVTFNPLQRSAKIPSRKCFSSFELIVRGTPNMHTTYSHINLSACLSFITVRGFASTHFMECSMAIAKNLKPPGVVIKGPRMLTPPMNEWPSASGCHRVAFCYFLYRGLLLAFFAVLKCLCSVSVH
ncbi:hypothetical protein Tco_1182947 [Tanacetum coccineum]